MKEELKLCPFCGEDASLCIDMPDRLYVQCDSYTCAIRTRVFWPNDDDQVVECWNTRPLEDALQAENERLRGLLAKALKHVPEENEYREGFFTVYFTNALHEELKQALTNEGKL